jgi:hypothetical protein
MIDGIASAYLCALRRPSAWKRANHDCQPKRDGFKACGDPQAGRSIALVTAGHGLIIIPLKQT